ncbi:hypothetical protein HYALB_00012378 [Hymenoscyphus albidus]|uniref:Uncharacterized protein n=1 Tax=Hymenoscyphus albidus TaxID=595503 RepID=A0A9N9LZT7_9HELO|nr:hypothetical protein HYALB_00012378 [Hymenoscyphus albidus]
MRPFNAGSRRKQRVRFVLQQAGKARQAGKRNPSINQSQAQHARRLSNPTSPITKKNHQKKHSTSIPTTTLWPLAASRLPYFEPPSGICPAKPIATQQNPIIHPSYPTPQRGHEAQKTGCRKPLHHGPVPYGEEVRGLVTTNRPQSA